MKTNISELFRSDESTNDIDPWAVIVRPPKEIDDDPRELSERLFDGLHGHGRLSFEAHSDGEDVELQIVAEDEPAARTTARHVRAELDAEAEIAPASMPVDESDALAAATFEYERDAIFPLSTNRTDEKDIGPLHHILDTLGEEDVRGVYQVVAEPVGDWTTRRSRKLPESISDEKDIEREVKRAGAAMMPVIGLSAVLSPWPVETSFVIGLGLCVAATVGEGVKLPQRRTADEIAHVTKERAKEKHGARSKKGKRAKRAAAAISEQDGSQGWRLAVRLVVAGNTPTDSVSHRDRLATQIERAYSSKITGQELVADMEQDARGVLDAVQERRPNQPTPRERIHRLLGHSTRKEMHGGTFVLSSLGYFPDGDGGGEGAREFSDETSHKSMDVPDAAPQYDRPEALDSIDESEFHVNPDKTETRLHPEYGEVEVQIIELRPDKDNDDHYAGAFTREWVESSEQDDSQIWVGYSEDDGQIREIGVPITQLRRPSFIAGASGAGKSTLAEIISGQHIWGGRGCAIIDPHDDFVDELLTKIPEHRRDDVIIIDPGNLESEHTHTINFLDVEVPRDHPDYDEAVNAVVGDTVGVISQGASKLGDRMKDTLFGVTRGMIISEKDYTFLDMRDVLRKPSEREEFAEQMRSEGHEFLAEFAEDLTELSNDDLAPVNRLFNKWVLSETAREIIRHTETSINFEEAIKNDKIILVRNDLSDHIQPLIATAIFSKIWRAARRRPRDERPLYPILIDEVDDIHTPEMDLASKLRNARKYGVGLTLMTQEPKEMSDLEEPIKQNCKLFVSFACPSNKQARTVSKIFACKEERVSQLGDYRALVQLDIDGERKGPLIAETIAPLPSQLTDDEAKEEIEKPSMRHYGVRRERLDATPEPETDGGERDVILDEFLRDAAEAARDGELVEDEHYTFVNKGTAREEFRINPSRSVEVLDQYQGDLDDILACSRKMVDEDDSYVSAHRLNTRPISRCTGADLNRVEGVDPGAFKRSNIGNTEE